MQHGNGSGSLPVDRSPEAILASRLLRAAAANEGVADLSTWMKRTARQRGVSVLALYEDFRTQAARQLAASEPASGEGN